MCANEAITPVRLETGYIQQLGQAKVDKLVSEGIFTKNPDGTYSTTNPAYANKGIAVESTRSEEPVVKTETNYASLKGFLKEGEAAQDNAMVKYLVQNGVIKNVTNNGKCEIAEGQDLQAAINKYNKEQAASRKPMIRFDAQNTDPEFIEELVSRGVITKNEDDTYNVEKKDELNKALDKELPEEGKTVPGKKISVATQKLTTEKDNYDLSYKKDVILEDDKAARKELNGKYTKALETWSKRPENKDTKEHALANMKYYNKIDKKAAKLAKEYQSNDAAIKAYYSDEKYSTKEEQAEFQNAVKEIIENVDEKTLLAEFNADHNRTGKAGQNIKQFTTYEQKEAAARSIIAKGMYGNTMPLIEEMAKKDVLTDRSERKIAKDDKYFVKEMAKREVQAKVDEQNFNNTTVHFTSDERKAAEKDEKNPAARHTSLTKSARKMVAAAPGTFCDVVTDEAELAKIKAEFAKEKGTADMNDKGYFLGKDLQGNEVYYKFSSDKYKEFFASRADSNDYDTDPENNFGKDNHITLNEARNAMKQQAFIDKDGNLTDLEHIIGNGNGKVGNKELQRLRRAGKKTGLGIDKNPTAWKRLGKAGMNAGIGFAAGFTAGAGLAVAIPAGIGTSTLGKVVDTAYHVPGETIHIPGETINVPGDTVTTIDHINGIEVENTTKLPDKNIVTPDKNYTTADKNGVTPYKVEDANWVDQGVRSGIAAATLNTIRSLFSLGKVHAKGTHWDGVINLERQNETKSDGEFEVEMQPEVITVRQGQIIKKSNVETKKPVRYRGPEAYSVLYQTEDGKSVDKRAFTKAIVKSWKEDYKKAHNGQEPNGPMPDNLLPIYADLVLDGDVRLVRRDDWEAVYDTIQVGTPGGRSGYNLSNVQRDRIYKGKGQIS